MTRQASYPSASSTLSQALGLTSTWEHHIRFSQLMRAVHQRMEQLDFSQPEQYRRYLNDHVSEATELLNQLNGDTPSLLDEDAQRVSEWLPAQLDTNQSSYRFWVCGVGTGNFAFHLLMRLLEDTSPGYGRPDMPYRIFGTDSLGVMIDWARWAHLSVSTVNQLPKSWQKKFFKLAANGYYFDRHLRQAIAFGQHHPLYDPPYLRQEAIFSLLDPNWIPQREWAQLQQRWYDSLQPNGLLWLAAQREAPSIIDHHKFTPDDKIGGLYRRNPYPSDLRVSPSSVPRATRKQPFHTVKSTKATGSNWRRLVQRRLVEEFVPPYAVLDARGRLVERNQPAVKWLTNFQLGNAPDYILNLIHTDLRPSMRNMLQAWQLNQENQEGEIIHLQMHGQLHSVKLRLRSMTNKHRYLLLAIEAHKLPTPPDPRSNILILGVGQPANLGFRPPAMSDTINAENLTLHQRNRSLNAQVARLHVEINRLQEESQALSWLKQHMRIGIWQWYPAEQRMEGDEGFYDIFQLDESMTNLAWPDLIPTDIIGEEAEWQAFEAWLQGQAPTPPEHGICFSVIAPRHGLRCLYLGTSNPQPGASLEDSEKHLTGFVIDITALVDQAEQAEAEMFEWPQSPLAPPQQEQLRLLSHELRTPLNSITSLIDLLENASDPADRNYMFKLLHRSADHLRYLCENILADHNLREGWLRIIPEQVDLRQLLDDIRLRFSRDALNKDLTFEYQIADDIPQELEIDPHRLQQILNNLLNNAIKSTRAGGIRLEVSLRRGPTQEDHYLIFRISDTGYGMSRPQLEKLLSQQTQRIPTKHAGGSGLGLYIIQQILRIWGGWLDVESRPKQGTTFLVGIPLPAETIHVARVQPPRPAATQATPGLALSGTWRILYVDDSDVNRLYVSALAHTYNLYIDILSSGEQAIRAMQEKRYETLLLDLSLLDRDSVELAQKIRAWQDPFFDQIPLLGVSANGQLQADPPASLSVFDGILIKPLVPEQVLVQLQAAVKPYLTHQLSYHHQLDLAVIRSNFGDTALQQYRILLDQLAEQFDQALYTIRQSPQIDPDLPRRMGNTMRILSQFDQAMFCRSAFLLAQSDADQNSQIRNQLIHNLEIWRLQVEEGLDTL